MSANEYLDAKCVINGSIYGSLQNKSELESQKSQEKCEQPNYLKLMNCLREMSTTNDYLGCHAAYYAKYIYYGYNLTKNTNIIPEMSLLEHDLDHTNN